MKWPWTRQPAPAPPAPDLQQVRALVSETVSAAVERNNAQQVEQLRALVAVAQGSEYEKPERPPDIYAFDHPIWYSTQQPPQRRPGSFLTVDTLRRLADSYDILRACIEHLKREVAATPLQISARDEKQKDAVAGRILEAEQFFRESGGLGGAGRRRQHFENALMEDLLVVGAGAVHYHPTRGGGLYQVVEIDAATIRPRVDAFGWPGPGDVVYEQWIEGLQVAGFTRQELRYDGIHARSNTPFFISPVEWLVQTTNAALRSDTWNLSWLTDGSTPDDVLALPENWTPDQIKAWKLHWDSMLSGDDKARHSTKFVPSGTQRVGQVGRKDNDFQEFMLWLARRTGAIMGVQLASIGFAGEQYKTSQEDSRESTSAFGVGSLLDYRKALYDDLLERQGFEELEAKNVTAREEAAKERAERLSILVTGCVFTPNEARAEEGKDPDPDGDELLVSTKLQPLSRALEDPEPLPGPGGADPGESDPPGSANTMRRALARWEHRCVRRLRQGEAAACPSESPAIPEELREQLLTRLAECGSVSAVRRLFRKAEQCPSE